MWIREWYGKQLVIPIKNWWSIIFDWSVGKLSIFFSIMKFRSSIFNHSILEWSNDLFFNFFPIFFDFFYQWICQVNHMQHWKSQKKKFTLFFYLFIVTVTDCIAWSIFWDRLIDQSIFWSFSTDQSNFSIFKNDQSSIKIDRKIINDRDHYTQYIKLL